MKFEQGKFYVHEAGRAIAILGEVETYKWGKQLVVEETDPTGHGISTINTDAVCIDGSWIEIGKPEWDRRFKEIYSCGHCGLRLSEGQKIMKTDDGKMYHEDCWKKNIDEDAP